MHTWGGKAVKPVLAAMMVVTLLTGAEPITRKWSVDGVNRDGLVAIPEKAKESPAPVVFVFHGHGGTAKHAARTFHLHSEWPEAIVVYLQGLNTPGRLTDPEGKKPGWQHRAGEQNDRDLKFFDVVLKSLRDDYQVDDKRIYSTGHSNGGAFTYLLWSERGDLFAAMAPSAAVANTRNYKLKPKPVLHLAGEKDSLVKFEWQKAGIDALRKLNGCEAEAKIWKHHKLGQFYESNTGTPVVAYIHGGDHGFPKAGPGLIVKFFKEHARK